MWLRTCPIRLCRNMHYTSPACVCEWKTTTTSNWGLVGWLVLAGWLQPSACGLKLHATHQGSLVNTFGSGGGFKKKKRYLISAARSKVPENWVKHPCFGASFLSGLLALHTRGDKVNKIFFYVYLSNYCWQLWNPFEIEVYATNCKIMTISGQIIHTVGFYNIQTSCILYTSALLYW